MISLRQHFTPGPLCTVTAVTVHFQDGGTKFCRERWVKLSPISRLLAHIRTCWLRGIIFIICPFQPLNIDSKLAVVSWQSTVENSKRVYGNSDGKIFGIRSRVTVHTLRIFDGGLQRNQAEFWVNIQRLKSPDSEDYLTWSTGPDMRHNLRNRRKFDSPFAAKFGADILEMYGNCSYRTQWSRGAEEIFNLIS